MNCSQCAVKEYSSLSVLYQREHRKRLAAFADIGIYCLRLFFSPQYNVLFLSMRQNAVINKRPHGCVFKIFKYVNAVFFRVNFAVWFIVDFDYVYSYFVVSVSACASVSVSFSGVSAATAPAEVDAGSSFLSFLHPAKEASARNARIAAIVLLSFIFLLFRLICFIAINLTIYICNQYKYSIAENLFVSSSVIIGACERYS